MAIRKDEIFGLTEEQKEILKYVEEKIDKYIKDRVSKKEGVRLSIWHKEIGYKSLHPKIKKELTDKYQNAGWRIKFKTDNICGNFFDVIKLK